MKPYYEKAGSCRCGCGGEVSPGRCFVSGHNLRNLPRSDRHRANIAAALRHAWLTKRTRLPVGATNTNRDGYVFVKVVPGKGVWPAQHTLVAVAKVGRALHRGEVVHHVNGVRSDNREENLYVCRNASHHNDVERTFSKLLPELLRRGVVVFDHERGEYRIS